MARKDHGFDLSSPLRQPDSELVYQHSGMIEGTLSYKIDHGSVGTFNSFLGSAHPDDPNVILYAARIRTMRAGIVIGTFDCIGLSKDPTDRVVSFPNCVNTEPIETHPDFTTFAGVPNFADISEEWTVQGRGQDDEFTGALFSMDSKGKITGFLGFTEAEAPQELRGVRSYYRASIMCRSTYYTRDKPDMQEPCTITDPEGELPNIDGITKWLHLVTSAEMVGKANLWRVTEEFIAGTDDQISDIIYG